MLIFTADPRDGVPSGSACSTCCCTPLTIKPGEVNKVTILYAPWSVPIGYPGIVPTPTIEFVYTGTCNGTGVSNTNYIVDTPVSTAIAINVLTNATGTLPLTAERVPLSGPENGTVTYDGATGIFTYTPQGGFVGYDGFTFRTTDADGHTVLRQVQVKVGAPIGAAPVIRTAPWVDMRHLQISRSDQSVSFAIGMPDSVRDCDSWRMWIKQPAKDCDGNVFYHYSCFDLSPGKC